MTLDLRSDGVWRVSAGEVHVFAVPRRGGVQTGPRRYLFSVVAPGLLVGGAGPGGFGLEAEALPGAVLEPGAGLDAAGVAQFVSGWFAAGAALLPARPKRGLVPAATGMAIPAETILDGGQGLVWCRVLEGEGVLFDGETVGGDGPALFPLGAGGWVRSFTAMRLEFVDTAVLLEQGGLEVALAEGMDLVQRHVATALNLAAVDEAMRRRRRDGQVEGDLRRVLGDLGRMVGFVAPQRSLPGANQTMFLAIHALATRMGQRAQMPAAVRDAEQDAEVGMAPILAASGLRARPVRLPEGWWRQELGDLLGEDATTGAPLALLQQGGGYLIEDPAAGTRMAATAAAAARVSPDARTLYELLPDVKLTMARMYTFGLRGSAGDIATLLLAALLAGWAVALPALASRLIMQDLVPQHLTGLLFQAGVALVGIGVLRAVFSYAGNIAFARIRARASARLKAAIWDRVLRQPMAFMGRYSAPDLALRCATIENIVAAVHQLAQQGVSTLAMLAVNLATMFWLSQAAGFAGLGLALVYVAAVWGAYLGQKRAFSQGEAAEGSVSVFVHALTNGMRKLRLAGAEERAFVKWGDRFTRSRSRLIAVRRVTNRFLTFAAGFDLTALAVVLAVLALLRADDLSVGNMFGFVIAFAAVTGSLSALGRAVTGVAFQFASIPYAQPVLDAVVPREARKASPGTLSGAVELANVHFAYPGGAPVLAGLNLRIAPGEFVAVVGASGSGKSTIARLVLGLERPQAGMVLFDQRDLEGLDIDAVRRQLGTVLQRPQLMPGSILENIRGTTSAGEDEVWDAAGAAGILPDIAAMPMRLHSLVAEGGQGLSGGQIQRIAIARAILRRPALLVLDEATSALDNTTQAQVANSLASLACARLVIAHRLSTVRRADRIVVLERGMAVEEGTHAELVARGGAYAALVRLQG